MLNYFLNKQLIIANDDKKAYDMIHQYERKNMKIFSNKQTTKADYFPMSEFFLKHAGNMLQFSHSAKRKTR